MLRLPLNYTAACGKSRGWQFIGNKCEVESYGEERHSLKLQSALVYAGHAREGVVGHQLTRAQKKSEVTLFLAHSQMGKASTRTGFLVLNVKFSTSNNHNKQAK